MAITTDTLKSYDLRTGTSPACKCFAITPHLTNYLSETQAGTERQIHTRAIMVTVAGNLQCVFAMDDTAVIIPVDANVVYPFSLKRIISTSTTATGIFGFR
jgi:hypothetical protein